jgi:hypothetical protein
MAFKAYFYYLLTFYKTDIDDDEYYFENSLYKYRSRWLLVTTDLSLYNT